MPSTKGKAPAAAPRRKDLQKVTLSKNGIRIGRPPKNPVVLHERLSSSVASASTSRGTGTPQNTRKRRRITAYEESDPSEGSSPEQQHGAPLSALFGDDGGESVEEVEETDEEAEDSTFSEELVPSVVGSVLYEDEDMIV